MEKTHLVLHPGERIRSPRILLLPWKGDRLAAHNRFRRLLLFHYVPKQDGRPLRLPDCRPVLRPLLAVAAQVGHRGRADPHRQGRPARSAATPTGSTPPGSRGGFPNGVGNWYLQAAGLSQRPEAGQRRVPHAGHEVPHVVRAGARGRRLADRPRAPGVRLRRRRRRAVQAQRPGGPHAG